MFYIDSLKFYERRTALYEKSSRSHISQKYSSKEKKSYILHTQKTGQKTRVLI